MADKSVGELIAAQSVTPTDLFVLEQNGTAKKLSGQILENWLVSFADGHGGIQSIEKLSTSGLVDTYRITLADTTTFDFVVNNGRGITGISKTGTSGLVDTYTISYSNGTTSKFTVTNGEKGDKGDNAYIWIKYASQEPTEASHSMGDLPDDWIGIYSGNASTAPTDWNQYKWFKHKGEQGDTGAAATLVNKSVTYQVSDSGTIIPSGEWGSSIPVVSQGKYLWTKTEVRFNTGDPIVSYSVARMGIDGSGAVSSVAGVSPDAAGNVTLTAADVCALAVSGGDVTGEIRMNGQPISGLNDPTEESQAARKGYVDASVRKAAPRNLLDNSDFRNPVNQRGQTSYNSAGYTIDRWAMIVDIGTINVVSDGLELDATGNAITFTQRLDDSLWKKMVRSGKTYTLAIDYTVLASGSDNLIMFEHLKDNTVSNGRTMDKSLGRHTFISQFTPNTADGESCYSPFHLFCRLGNKIVLHTAALYEGSYTAETLPEYQPKGYAAEFSECQRYFQRLNAEGTDWKFYDSVIRSQSIVVIFASIAPMRISPTVSYASGETIMGVSAPGNVNVYDIVNTRINGVFEVKYVIGDSQLMFALNVANTGAGGNRFYALIGSNGSGYIDLSADL